MTSSAILGKYLLGSTNLRWFSLGLLCTQSRFVNGIHSCSHIESPLYKNSVLVVNAAHSGGFIHCKDCNNRMAQGIEDKYGFICDYCKEEADHESRYTRFQFKIQNYEVHAKMCQYCCRAAELEVS